jgi:ABC-2 type transport system permease protein
MKSIVAILRKEMQLYLVSPIAYAVVGVFLIITGFFFQVLIDGVIREAQRQAMQAMQMGGGMMEIDMPGVVMRQFFGLMGTILLFLMPMMTMGVYADERRRGTMELLMTSPITDLQIVLGKFLASLALLGMMLLPTVLELALLYRASDPAPSWRLVLAGYIGLFLLGGALLAIGTFVSSLTENQIIAAVGTFGLTLLLWLIDAAVRSSTNSVVSEVLQYLSVLRHFEDFTRGVVDTSALIFYASLIALSLLLTLRSLDSMRWRRA